MSLHRVLSLHIRPAGLPACAHHGPGWAPGGVRLVDHKHHHHPGRLAKCRACKSDQPDDRVCRHCPARAPGCRVAGWLNHRAPSLSRLGCKVQRASPAGWMTCCSRHCPGRAAKCPACKSSQPQGITVPLRPAKSGQGAKCVSPPAGRPRHAPGAQATRQSAMHASPAGSSARRAPPPARPGGRLPSMQVSQPGPPASSGHRPGWAPSAEPQAGRPGPPPPRLLDRVYVGVQVRTAG